MPWDAQSSRPSVSVSHQYHGQMHPSGDRSGGYSMVVKGLHHYTDCVSVLGMMFNIHLSKPPDLVGPSLSGPIAALLGGKNC